MKNNIDKQTIEEIRLKNDIVDVISQYVPVEKKGNSYVCVCPFHDDHSPSLSISSEKQIYRCFACGAAGGVFQFVMDFEKISFPQAVIKLGKNVGYDLAYQTIKKEVDPTLKPYYEILQETIQYTQFQLLTNEKAKKYIQERNIPLPQVERFQLGFDDGNLERFLLEKGYDYELMKRAYLVFNNIDGTSDVFKNRLLFPIHDLNGNPVGFSGRTIENANAKYINTSETKVYTKGKLLYNYHRVKQSENKKEMVYLVEGTMDVLAFDQAGVSNCVATLGTAVTKDQIKALQRLNTTINVCFDPDDAGQNATYKFGIIANQYQLKFEIVDWTSEKDPDEMIQTQGKEAFLKTIQKTKSWITFLFAYLKTKYNLSNYTDKKQYGIEIANEITLLKDEIEKKHYFELLKEITGVDYTSLDVKKIEHTILRPQSQTFKKMERAQLEILNQIIISKRACDLFLSHLVILPNQKLNEIAQNVVNLYHEMIEIPIATLIENLTEEQRLIVLNLQEDELFVNHFKEAIVFSNIRLIQIHLLEEQQNKIKQLIAKETIKEKRDQYIQDGLEITKKIIELRNDNGGNA